MAASFNMHWTKIKNRDGYIPLCREPHERTPPSWHVYPLYQTVSYSAPLTLLPPRLNSGSQPLFWNTRSTNIFHCVLNIQDDCIRNTTAVCGSVVNVILDSLLWRQCCYVTAYCSLNLGYSYVRTHSDQSDLSRTNRCLSSLRSIYIPQQVKVG